jgi:PrtD family type I secretion system ABC transporter
MKSFDKIVGAYKYVLGSVLLCSVFVNVLGFATPLYSLQLLDRVVSSSSIDTLLMLTIITALCAVVSGMIGMARSLVVSRAQGWIERHVTPELMKAAIFRSCGGDRVSVNKFMQDLHQVNQFVTQHAVNFFFDVPWALVALIVIFLIHPIIGLVTLFGAAFIILLAFLYEKVTRGYIEHAEDSYSAQSVLAQEAIHNADALKANGMLGSMVRHFSGRHEDYIHAQMAVGKRSSYITGTLKIFRMLLQMAIMGLGVFFVLEHEMSLGAVIANSILSSKVFGPFEQSIMAWKHFVNARKSYGELSQAFGKAEETGDHAVLPVPEGNLSLEDVTYVTPGSNRTIVNNVSFALKQGEILGVIGRNAAGKSTIIKMMAGVIAPTEGKVRLDGVDVYQAAAHDYGRHIGYLPQNWQLFNDTVARNVARLQDVEENSAAILEAAAMVGMHEMILRMPQGYETKLGGGGMQLSGGQLQGVALSRAFFGNPKLVILDEPTSNLDKQGEEGLLKAMRQAKERGVTIVIVTHDSSMLMLCDKIAVVEEGKLRSFGTKEEVFKAGPAAKGGGGRAQAPAAGAAANEAVAVKANRGA